MASTWKVNVNNESQSKLITKLQLNWSEPVEAQERQQRELAWEGGIMLDTVGLLSLTCAIEIIMFLAELARSTD